MMHALVRFLYLRIYMYSCMWSKWSYSRRDCAVFSSYASVFACAVCCTIEQCGWKHVHDDIATDLLIAYPYQQNLSTSYCVFCNFGYPNTTSTPFSPQFNLDLLFVIEWTQRTQLNLRAYDHDFPNGHIYIIKFFRQIWHDCKWPQSGACTLEFVCV